MNVIKTLIFGESKDFGIAIGWICIKGINVIYFRDSLCSGSVTVAKRFLYLLFRKSVYFSWMNKISKNGLRLWKIKLVNRARIEEQIGIKKSIASQLFAYFCPRNSFLVFCFFSLWKKVRQQQHIACNSANTGPNQVKFFLSEFCTGPQHLQYPAPSKSVSPLFARAVAPKLGIPIQIFFFVGQYLCSKCTKLKTVLGFYYLVVDLHSSHHSSICVLIKPPL